jgi:hypothetical protein
VTEVIVAVFDTASVANAAVRDLEAAHIPSALIQRFICEDAEHRIAPTHLQVGDRPGWPLVTVAVDEMHCSLVAGILDRHAPVDLHETL